jgi:hypothetical protein
MNRKLAATLVLAAAAAGNAFADDITIDTTPFASARSRVEVQAELGQFKKAGPSPWSIQYNPVASFKSGKSRDQVTAEYLASRNQVAAFTAEDSGSAYLAQNRARTVGTTLAGQPKGSAQ